MLSLRLRSSLRPIIICVISSSLVSAVFERAAVLTVAQNEMRSVILKISSIRCEM
jgi:hypothetical protein